MKIRFLMATALALVLTAGTAHAQYGTDAAQSMSANGGVNADSGIGTPGANLNGPNTADMRPQVMNPQQFSTFTRGRWDSNADGLISRQEWTSYAPTWFGQRGNAYNNAFASWDANNNGVLDSAEMQRVFSNSGLYQLYDLNNDGVIDNAESAKIPPR